MSSTITTPDEAIAATAARVGVPYATFLRPHRDGDRTVTVAMTQKPGSTQFNFVVREEGEFIDKFSSAARAMGLALKMAGYERIVKEEFLGHHQ
jgi:hypothetical protein